MANEQGKTYPPTSGRFLVATVLSFFSGLFILIGFASPYWLESFGDTHQDFVRMGLWEFCFNNFRYPRFQLDRKFHGCHWVFSEEFLVIREWLQPGWLMFVEAMMCLALIFAFTSLVLIAIVLMRYLLKYEVYLLGSAFVLQNLTAAPSFLAVAVFGARCQDRTWFLNPLYNHPSWAYGLVVIAFFFSIFASVFLYKETKDSWENKRRQRSSLVESTPYRY